MTDGHTDLIIQNFITFFLLQFCLSLVYTINMVAKKISPILQKQFKIIVMFA